MVANSLNPFPETLDLILIGKSYLFILLSIYSFAYIYLINLHNSMLYHCIYWQINLINRVNIIFSLIPNLTQFMFCLYNSKLLDSFPKGDFGSDFHSHRCKCIAIVLPYISTFFSVDEMIISLFRNSWWFCVPCIFLWSTNDKSACSYACMDFQNQICEV